MLIDYIIILDANFHYNPFHLTIIVQACVWRRWGSNTYSRTLCVVVEHACARFSWSSIIPYVVIQARVAVGEQLPFRHSFIIHNVGSQGHPLKCYSQCAQSDVQFGSVTGTEPNYVLP